MAPLTQSPLAPSISSLLYDPSPSHNGGLPNVVSMYHTVLKVEEVEYFSNERCKVKGQACMDVLLLSFLHGLCMAFVWILYAFLYALGNV